jgi:hypothetical protein
VRDGQDAQHVGRGLVLALDDVGELLDGDAEGELSEVRLRCGDQREALPLGGTDLILGEAEIDFGAARGELTAGAEEGEVLREGLAVVRPQFAGDVDRVPVEERVPAPQRPAVGRESDT